jgi:hypothetical protein
MCTVLLPPGVNPVAVKNKLIIIIIIIIIISEILRNAIAVTLKRGSFLRETSAPCKVETRQVSMPQTGFGHVQTV